MPLCLPRIFFYAPPPVLTHPGLNAKMFRAHAPAQSGQTDHERLLHRPFGKFPQENLNFMQEKGRRIRWMSEHSTPVKDARPGIKRRLGHA
jgi:hypothetical protein